MSKAGNKPWTLMEEQFLIKNNEKGAVWIAQELNRSHHAINQRAHKLRLGLGKHKKKLKLIIRLDNFKQKKNVYPKKPPYNMIRKMVMARDNWTCVYCGGIAQEVDHVLPRHLGGHDFPSNLVAACKKCNYYKSTNCVDCPRWREKRGI